ncbi:hypothetical protein SUGI_0479620 [Cryptomeria japonica]|nr:hypothetical protein SUGI_0479620 [Cryptomeria japonica]
MSVIQKLCFLLALASLGAAHVYPIHRKNDTDISTLVERDVQRIGRRLQANVKTALFGLEGKVFPNGIYYIKALIGTPPKEYYLHIDTGSDLTWLQCNSDTRSCAKTPHPWYTPKSVVYCTHPLCEPVREMSHGKYDCIIPSQPCYYDIRYIDYASTLGKLVSDIFTVRLINGTIFKPLSIFGCGYDQYGSLKVPQATDGILGLSGDITSLPSQWAKQGYIKNVIGICIAGGGNAGGYMFFGDDHVPTLMTWVPLLRGPTMRYYHVGPAEMIYGGQPLAKDGDEKSLGGIMFDSGTTYTYFTEKSYGALVPAVEENLANQLVRDSSDTTRPLCWRGKEPFRSIADPRVTSYFKPLVFNFKNANAKFEISPEGYLIISKEGNVCLGILKANGLKSLNIIGDISMQGYLVVHDNDNNRIGWTRKDCMNFWSSASYPFPGLAAASRL